MLKLDFFPKVEPGNMRTALDLWFNALTEKAEAPIPKKWIGRLDVFAKENIKIMAVAHRVDQPKDL
ncbi:MAG TPA: hypothetical protein DGT23_21650 [Micromonosporaceae bacterium]|nr:hypothetical protein [Micromonosporaceae bacterium]